MVKVLDKQTGQVIEVAENQLSQYGLSGQTPAPQAPVTQTPQTTMQNPSMVDQETMASDPEQLKYQNAWQSTGNLKTRDAIAGSWKTAKGYELFGKPEVSAQDQKIKNSYSAAQNYITNLEKQYADAQGGQLGTGIEAGIKGAVKTVKGEIGYDPNARVYNLSRKGFTASLRDVTGDVGVLTQQDFERIAGLLPKLGYNPQEAIKQFNMVRSQIAAKYGQKVSDKTEFSEKLQPFVKEPNLGRELTNLLIPKTKEAITQKIPEYTTSGRSEPQQGESFLNYLGRTGKEEVSMAAPVAGEIINNLLALSAGKSIAGGVKGLVSGGGPKAVIGKARDVAAQQASQNLASGSKIAEAGEKYLASDPLAKTYAEKVGGAIKDQVLTPVDLLDKLGVWNKAYSAAGRVGSSSKAGYYNALARAGKEEMQRIAPEVSKLTGKLNFLYKAPKAVKGTLFTLATTAGGIAALKWLLSGGKSTSGR